MTSEQGVSLVSCLMNLDRWIFPDQRDDLIGVRLINDEWSGDGPIRGPKATIIVKADDWGRDVDTTDVSLDCVRREVVSSVSAMVFMEDSERASVLAQEHAVPHISVCICTYKRPLLLKRLLTDLSLQETGGLFTYSAVVADNDETKSAEAIVAEIRSTSTMPVKYCVEPIRGIASARNRVVGNAEGEFLAFIDDDEFPVLDWLLILFKTCNQYKVDGVFGPVKRHFDEVPPVWIKKSGLYDRRVNPTGMRVDWREARTSNVMLRREILVADPSPFRVQLRSGEDQDFFKRKMEKGRVFIWCAEAGVFEVVPPSRWKRKYLLRKALMRGDCTVKRGELGVVSIARSLIAVPLYTLALPFAQLLGHHRFMTLLVKLCDHLGKLLALVGLHPIKEAYVME